MKKMMKIWFVVLCLVTSSTIGHSLLKSIQTKSGSVVDCIDIYKQPALDLPSLKNHKLQEKPSLEGKTSVEFSPNNVIHALEKVECPYGTIPIQRRTEDNLNQSKFALHDPFQTQTNIQTYSSLAFVAFPIDSYYGVSGTTSVYNPKVLINQTSASVVYLQSGEGNATNKIVIGWHVHPRLYNDDETHFFSLWTSDNFKSGCFNMMCPGFVQIDRSYFLGSRLTKTTMYGSEYTVELSISLFQDAKTQNWWLKVEDKAIGYFPALLFSNLTKADQVGWGGIAMTPVGVPKPPMGTGHFPDDDSLLIRACYFRDVAFQNASRQEDYPQLYLTQFYQNAPCNCYHVGIYEFPENSDQFGGFAGSFIQFGGPGGDCGNDNFFKLFGLVCVIIIMVFVIVFFLICLRAYLNKSSGSCCDVVARKL